MSEFSEEPKTSLFEVLVAVLLGLGALGGGWAGYQSSQWGGTATEDYGKAATTATRAGTEFNHANAVVDRDINLDIEAKEHIVTAMLTKDDIVKLKDTTIAKYLYTQQMTKQGYSYLKYPAKYHSRKEEEYSKFTDEELAANIDNELDEGYRATSVKPATDLFLEADKIFAEGQKVSGTSTQFGLDGVFFTITLFLGGIGLVLKSHIRWVFMGTGYLTLIYAMMKMISLPWYHA
jgi:hypothetical protein